MLADQAGEEAAADRADVHAGLVQPHRARARVASVIVADERHRRGEVERLPESLGRPKEEQLAEIRATSPSPCRSGSTPAGRRGWRSSAGRGRRSFRHRRRESVDPRERRAEQPELHRRQVHLALEQREDREDRLAVGVVEERRSATAWRRPTTCSGPRDLARVRAGASGDTHITERERVPGAWCQGAKVPGCQDAGCQGAGCRCRVPGAKVPKRSSSPAPCTRHVGHPATLAPRHPGTAAALWHPGTRHRRVPAPSTQHPGTQSVVFSQRSRWYFRLSAR